MTDKNNVKQKTFILELSKELHQLLKMKSIESQMTMKEFIRQAIREKVDNGTHTNSI